MRPLLVGMNNPVSTRAGHELYPAPGGCTGHRLWAMLHARTGAFRQQYLDAFERCNLVRGLEYNRSEARLRAGAMLAELRQSGRTVVLLGQSVREAFDRATQDDGGLAALLIHPQVVAGVTWRQVPHPSGRNLWYNERRNAELVELLMEELYDDYRKKSR